MDITDDDREQQAFLALEITTDQGLIAACALGNQLRRGTLVSEFRKDLQTRLQEIFLSRFAVPPSGGFLFESGGSQRHRLLGATYPSQDVGDCWFDHTYL